MHPNPSEQAEKLWMPRLAGIVLCVLAVGYFVLSVWPRVFDCRGRPTSGFGQDELGAPSKAVYALHRYELEFLAATCVSEARAQYGRVPTTILQTAAGKIATTCTRREVSPNSKEPRAEFTFRFTNLESGPIFLSQLATVVQPEEPCNKPSTSLDLYRHFAPNLLLRPSEPQTYSLSFALSVAEMYEGVAVGILTVSVGGDANGRVSK